MEEILNSTYILIKTTGDFHNRDYFVWLPGSTPLTSWTSMIITWILYFGGIVVLHSIMKNFEPIDLKPIAIIHNFILTFWSLIMLLGITYDLYQIYQTDGLVGLYCLNPEVKERKGPVFYWLYIYFISKFYELFDTLFIILRKKPIIFLHIFHHGIVILMVWIWSSDGLIYSSIGLMFNTFVHVWMYGYYGLSLILPGQVSWMRRPITSLQIFQFVSSFILSFPYLYYFFQKDCQGIKAFIFAFSLNSFFLYLFLSFFRKTYSSKKK